jgi:hypothetical protein
MAWIHAGERSELGEFFLGEGQLVGRQGPIRDPSPHWNRTRRIAGEHF